jgi:predicted HAD superfamily hydrolase
MQIKHNAPSPTSNRTYSFDVFDTCVTRTYAHPRDLFYELGLRLAPAHLTRKQRHSFAAQFQRLRIRAEKKAHRLARPRHTVTINEIYTHFSKPNSITGGIQDLIGAELDLERESLYPIPAMVSHIESLRQAGNRIVFISDMYLPSFLLAPLLKEQGVMKEEDTLYVSCDVGLTKHHGQLFHHVLKSEGLEPSQLIHTGDNLRGDIKMARGANIKANHFRGGMLTNHEANIAGRKLPRHGAKSFLAALARRLRLSGPAQADDGGNSLDHVIHGIIVPFLLIYVMWVLDHAKRKGIRRLYFVARDAEILWRMAQALQGEDDVIQLRYLYGSRLAWLPHSIPLDDANLQRLLIVGETNSRHDIIARMGLDAVSEEAVRNLLSYSKTEWLSPLSRDHAYKFLAKLLDDTATSKLVGDAVAQNREATLSYFKQEGLFDEAPWALVDAGWSLTAQAALKRTLAAGQAEQRIPRGYYIALHLDHLDEAQAGIAYPFIPKAGSIFSRRRVIIEHCFLPSTHTSTRGYRMEGSQIQPVVGPELRTEAELSYTSRLHEIAISAARLVASDPKAAASLTEHAEEILSGTARFLRHPSTENARAMATFGTVADMRHEAAFMEPLCGRLSFKDLCKVISMVIFKGKHHSPFMWLEGSMALSPLHVRIPLELLLGVDSLRHRLKGRH